MPEDEIFSALLRMLEETEDKQPHATVLAQVLARLIAKLDAQDAIEVLYG